MIYTLKILSNLGWGDFQNVKRDSMLAWMLFLPFLITIVISWGVPPLQTWLLDRYHFDLSPYYPVLMSYFFMIATPIVFGTIIGFLLLDERDDQTFLALQMTPMSLRAYLAYRLGMPILVSVLVGLCLFPLFDLIQLPFSGLLLLTALAALEAPLFALFLASFAENKVAGFALMKAASAVMLLPIVAYFSNSTWQFLAGFIPSYWPMKVFWVLAQGGNFWPYLLFGLLYHLLGLWALIKYFDKVIHR